MTGTEALVLNHEDIQLSWIHTWSNLKAGTAAIY